MIHQLRVDWLCYLSHTCCQIISPYDASCPSSFLLKYKLDRKTSWKCRIMYIALFVLLLYNLYAVIPFSYPMHISWIEINKCVTCKNYFLYKIRISSGHNIKLYQYSKAIEYIKLPIYVLEWNVDQKSFVTFNACMRGNYWKLVKHTWLPILAINSF